MTSSTWARRRTCWGCTGAGNTFRHFNCPVRRLRASEWTARLATGTAGEGANTFRAHGVTFQYPDGWQDTTDDFSVATTSGEALWTAAVSADTYDLVIVEAYSVNQEVTADNLDAAEPEVTAFFEQLFGQMDGALESGPEDVTLARLPGLEYTGRGASDGTPIESRIIVAFDGSTEYFINCQHTEEGAAEINQGCDQIVNTFALE